MQETLAVQQRHINALRKDVAELKDWSARIRRLEQLRDLDKEAREELAAQIRDLQEQVDALGARRTVRKDKA